MLAKRALDELCRSLKDRRGWGPLKAEQVDDDDKKARCVESFDKTEDEAKLLAHQFVDNKVTEVCEEQLSNPDDRIAVVQKSISEFHASVAAPVMEHIAPAPTVSYVALVVECIEPAPATSCGAPAPAVHAAHAPMVEHIAPAPVAAWLRPLGSNRLSILISLL